MILQEAAPTLRRQRATKKNWGHVPGKLTISYNETTHW